MKIIFSQDFEKSLNRIHDKIRDLAAGKENLDIKKLKTGKDYRLRIGDYRLFFEYSMIENKIVAILHTVLHRKDAYKK